MAAKDISKQLDSYVRSLERKIQKAVSFTLHQIANRIFQEAMGALPSGSANLRASFRMVVNDQTGQIEIYSDSVIAAYVEFGTGRYAAAYLSGKRQEMVDEAMKFYVNGEGNMPAQPSLYPAYFRWRDRIVPEIDKAIQKVLDAA